MKKLTIVVPCYNEEEALSTTANVLFNEINKLINLHLITPDSDILFVDDGSKDNTWKIIKKLSNNNKLFRGIKLSINRGHQNALLAGLENTESDIVISIDADLQDDVSIMEKMINENINNNVEIVFGVRDDRSTDSFLKRQTASKFYGFMQLLGINIIYNHADYRLLSRKVIDNLKLFREVNLFLRGIIPSLGYKTKEVTYKRYHRNAGETKYTPLKMLSFAWEGITSFSVAPLRLVTILGVSVFFLSIIMGIYVFWIKFISNQALPGWASTVLPIYLLGGVQLLSLGLIGEYLAKVYQETKARPRYFIEETTQYQHD